MLYDDDEGKKFNEGTVSIGLSFRTSSVNASPSQIKSSEQSGGGGEGGESAPPRKSTVEGASSAQELAKLADAVQKLQAYPDYYSSLPGPTVARVARI
jgi:hypothetical protein